jgi:hypothetical protein
VLHRLFHHFRALLRAKSATADARLRLLMRRALLLSFAGLIAVFGLGMLNAAAFLALESRWGPLWAAAAAALADFVLAIAIAAIALILRSSSKLNAAIELHQTALDGIEHELCDLQAMLPWRSHRAMNPLDIALPDMLIPLATVIIRGLRKHRVDRQ